MSKKTRIWIPATEFAAPGVRTKIKAYVWSSTRGLECVYKDGLTIKSDYTLPEFLDTEVKRFQEV